MHFDDRLETVLRLPAGNDTFARIQFRQLIDILGHLPESANSELVDAAYVQLQALSVALPLDQRARVLEEPMARITAPRLLAHLAESEPRMATAAVRAAQLDERAWLDLIPRLPVRARGILRHRRDLNGKVVHLLDRLGVADRGLPAVEGGPIAGLRPDAPRPAVTPDNESGIGAIVRRIEEFRKARQPLPRLPEQAELVEESPRLPLGDSTPTRLRPAAIDFATDCEGRISTADPHVAPALIGHRLAGGEGGALPIIAAAIRHRQPIDDALVTLSGAATINGEWRLDALPQFDLASGRYTGYAGRLRRPSRTTAAPGADATQGEADRMRQVLHELRTPANAIQVAAEIIQQQLFGPAPHEYRALAAAIAADAAHILAGFEELDRLVKLECRALTIDAGLCDFAEVLEQTVTRLSVWTSPRRSGFRIARPCPPMPLPIARAEAERFAWRLLAALAGSTAPDEVLPIDCDFANGSAIVSIAIPRALADRTDAELFHGAVQSGPPAANDGAGAVPGERRQNGMSSGMFGIGFTLRLAAAEVRAGGGKFQREDNTLLLQLPGLTHAAAIHSDSC